MGRKKAVPDRNQETGLKGCSGVLLESKPILISHTGLRVAHQHSLMGNVLFLLLCSLIKQFAVSKIL